VAKRGKPGEQRQLQFFFWRQSLLPIVLGAPLPRVFGFGLREGEPLSEPAISRFNLSHGANPANFSIESLDDLRAWPKATDLVMS
jgi:hypothetical protein